MSAAPGSVTLFGKATSVSLFSPFFQRLPAWYWEGLLRQSYKHYLVFGWWFGVRYLG